MSAWLRAAVVVVSDGVVAGTRTDESGPAARQALEAAGLEVVSTEVVPDEAPAIRDVLRRLAASGVPLVLTSGGTGFAPRDVTPEATAAVIEREAEGLAELLRRETAAFTRFAPLSRGRAGIRGGTLIVNAPGSPKGVRQYVEILAPLLPHALQLVSGGPTGHASGPDR